MPTMLPALPDTLGNIRQVFPAVLASLRGEANALKLQPVRHAIVILVDGLGAQNLAARTALAPTLEKHHSSQTLTSVFPSSTVANLTSLATGFTPDKHGLFGYRIFDRDRGEEFNLLSGMDKYSILDYLKQEPLSASNPFNVVTLEAYRDSGFSRATMHGASHYFADDLEDRFRIAAELSAHAGQITYLYVPELDQTAHAFGWQSENWAAKLCELDTAVGRLLQRLPTDVGVLLTSDHGVVDVDHSNHLYLDEVIARGELLAAGGDPRAMYLYFAEGTSERYAARIQDWLGDRGMLLTQQQMFETGLFGARLREDQALLPDLVLLPEDGRAAYHREFAKVTSMRMIGQHGGLSNAEVELPLLRMAGFEQVSD